MGFKLSIGQQIYNQNMKYWTFAAAFKSVQKCMHESSKNQGFWELKHESSKNQGFWELKHKSLWYKTKAFFGWKQKDVSDNRSMCEEIALIHTELSEAVEALRDGNPKSKKIPEYSCVEEELADVILRIMDFAEGHHFDVAGATVAKDKYNYSRSYKHGRKF